MDYAAPRRVKLVVDLTRYDERLTVGELGTTTKANYGMASGDNFAHVKFDNGASLPIAFASIDVMEP